MPTSIVQRCRLGREAYGSRHGRKSVGCHLRRSFFWVTLAFAPVFADELYPSSVRPDHQLAPTDVQMHGENAQPFRVLRHDFCDIVIETRAFSRAGSGSMPTRGSRTSEMEMAA
jgi:hypothetical protein